RRSRQPAPSSLVTRWTPSEAKSALGDGAPRRRGRGYRSSMAGDARVVWMPGGVRTEIHLAGEDTGGAFCLLVDHPPAGWSLPAHRHRNEAETIHVVEGDFAIEIDGRLSQLSLGETIHVPRGAVHASAN